MQADFFFAQSSLIRVLIISFRLVERCYEYIDVTSKEGDSIKSILSKTIGESKAEHFLKEAFNVQVNVHWLLKLFIC